MNQTTLTPEQLISKVLQELQEIKSSLQEIRTEIKEIKEQRPKTNSSTQTSSNFQPTNTQTKSEQFALAGKISQPFQIRQTKDDKKRDFYFAFLTVEQRQGMSEKEQEYVGKEIKVFFFEPNFDLTMALQKVEPEHEITVVGFFNNLGLFIAKELENNSGDDIII